MTAEVLTPSAPAAEVAVVDVPVAEEKTIEAEPPTEEAVAAELQKELAASVSFKEETNVVGELPEAQKKALDELKVLVQEALSKGELSGSSVPVKEEEKPAPVVQPEVVEAAKAEETAVAAAVVEDAPAAEPKKVGFWGGIPKVNINWGRQAPKEGAAAAAAPVAVAEEATVVEEKKEEVAAVAEPVVATEEKKEEVVAAPAAAEEAKEEKVAEAEVAAEAEEGAPAAEKKKKKVSINWGMPKVNLSWGFTKKDKAPVVVEEAKKEEGEATAVTEAPKEEATAVPVTEEAKEGITVTATEEPKKEITVPVTVEAKKEIKVPATEEPKEQVIAPATEDPKEVTAPAPEAPKEEVKVPAIEEPKDIEVISAPVSEPKEEVTAPAAEAVVAAAPEEPKDKEVISEVEKPTPAPIVPEEVSIWGVKLLADEKSDTVLLKFLRARDFKVKEAFVMLRNTVRWQKEFKIDAILEEDLGTELEKVVYMSGYDKEGHPVCYNVYGEFQNKELYQSTFGDLEKPNKFLRWRVQFLEKTIRKDLEFGPDGVCTFVQVNDLKASPGPLKRELKVATNQALQLFQDNYPEFVAKQVFINVPWYYLAFYKMIGPFFTQRTKSKFVVAGPSKSAETLFKYIAPEQVPVQYGGLKLEGEQEFTTADTATEEIIKPSTKSIIEFPCSEASTLVWEARVIGWDVLYGAEFVPTAEGGYTVIIQKLNKIASTDETILCGNYKPIEAGKVVITFDNSASSKKKKLLYRSKTKPSE